MPTPLDVGQLSRALQERPDWAGGPDRIWRTTRLTTDEDAELRRLVAAAADAMDHHPVLEDDAGATRWVLWTHSAGGVTDLDLTLASRIDVLVGQVTGHP